MPDSRHPSHRPDGSTEDRFLYWVDQLGDPNTGTAPPPDPDFADVAETATSIHRAAGLGASTAPLPERVDAMWESLMHTSAAMPASTVNPGAFNGSAPPPAPPRPMSRPAQPGWRSYLMTAALIAIIVTASVVALWQITDPLDGRDPGTANQPGFIASATPATETPEGCDLTRDMLVFVGEAPSFDGTNLDPTLAVVQPDGDFVITCDGVDDPEPLLTGVTNARPLQWPGTVLLERDDGSTVVVNVATREQVDLGTPATDHGMEYIQQLSSAWLASPNNAAATDWRITNLETMASFALSDELGGVLPESLTESITAADDASTAVISFDGALTSRARLAPDAAGALPPNPDDANVVEVPEGSLVVDSTFETRRWIDTWGQVAVSPDGSTIAYQTQNDLTPMIRIEDAITGDVLAELTGVKFTGTTPTQFAFSGDGEALVYLDGNDVWIATWQGTLETTLVDTGDMRPSVVSSSSMPDRVIIEEITDDDIGGQKIAILDTSTGTFTDLSAQLTDSRLGFGTRWSQLDYVVAMTPDEASQSRTVMQLIDLHTGEPVLTSEPIQESIDTLLGYTRVTFADGNGQGSVANVDIAYSDNGAVAVVNVRDGQSIVFNAITGTVAPVSVEWDEDIAAVDGLRWLIIPSTDGEMFYGVGAQPPGTDITSPEIASTIAIAPVSPNPEWSEPSDVDPIGVIHGITPGGDNDEPAVLEAQEITPIAASPAATPATPVAAGCDLTGDMPIFAGSAPENIALNTWLLLDDTGTLTLNCGSNADTIASGVEQVKPTAWPGAIALVMQDGTGQLLNLANGATATLGSGELLDHSGQVTTATTEFVTAPHSPWLVSIANGNRTDWRITDLRTMESLLLSDEIGGPLPEPRLPLISNGLSSQADIANGTEVAVIAFMNGEFEAAGTPDANVETGSLPTTGAALVLPGTLDARRWVDLSPAEARIPILSAGVSADGSLLAYITTADSGDEVIRIVRTTSGEDVAELPIEQTECPPFTNQVLMFVGSEPRLLYSDACSIEILSWSPDIERMPLDLDLLSGDVRLYPTADPDIVLLEQGGGAMTIDVTDGTVIREFQYVPYLGNQLQFSDGHGYIGNMITVTEEPDGLSVIQVVDPLSGEVLTDSQTMGPAELEGVQTIPAHPIQLTQTYPAFLVRDGTLAILQLPPNSAMEVPPLPPAAVIVMDVNTSEMWMIKLPPYDSWYLIASPDGRYLYNVPARTVLDGEAQSFMMKSTGVGSDWAEVPAGSVPSFVTGTHDLPAASSNEPTVLEAQEITPIAASPAATPAASESTCDLTGDMPIFAGTLPDAAFVDTYLLLDEGGTLSLNCDKTSETIASGVAQVEPTSWPATIILATENGTVDLLNLTNGANLELESDALLNESGRLNVNDTRVVATARHSPWLLTAANGTLTDWRITDLRTMESFLLSDEIGGRLPKPMRPFFGNNSEDRFDIASGSQVGFITFVDSSGIPLPSTANSESTPEMPTSVLPPEHAALVLPGSIEERHWIDISPAATRIAESVSADGSLLAYIGTSDSGAPVIRVEQSENGTLIAEVPIDKEGVNSFVVSAEPARLAYSNGRSIELYDLNSPSNPTTIDASALPSMIYWMTATGSPNTVLVSDESSAVTLNLNTGEVGHTFSYVPYPATQTQYVNGASRITNIVVMTDDPRTGASAAIQLVDPLTGQVLVKTDPVEITATSLEANRYVSLARDGTLAVVPIAPDRTMVLDATSGTSWVVEVPNDEIIGWVISPSADGQLIYATSSRTQFDMNENYPFLMTAASPDADWVEVEPDSTPRFVIGTHDLPAASSNEPTVLEAQEITPIAASPAATPAASESTCDLTSDIPVATGTDVLPWDRTTAILSDGTLALHCGGERTVVIEGVTEVRGTGWPGAMILTMEDGTLHGVNLLTGATGDFGPETVLTEQVPGVTGPFLSTQGSPWLALPANPEATDWRILDLRTMESFVLSDEIGGQLPRSTVISLYASTPDAAEIGFPGTLMSPATPAPDTSVAALPVEHAALVIDGSLDNRRWTSVTNHSMAPTAISPNGELLAIEVPKDTGLTVRVERLSDGELVANTGIDYAVTDDMILLNDGLLHLTDGQLDLVTWDPQVDSETLLELNTGQEATSQEIPFQAGGSDTFLKPTATPGVVIVAVMNPDGTASGFLVNTAIGETTGIPHLLGKSLVVPGYGTPNPPQYILAAAPAGDDGNQATIQLIDVTTGDIAVESNPVAIPTEQVTSQPSMLRARGTIGISVYQPGHAVVLNATTGESFTLQAPAESFYPSLDGTYISAAAVGTTTPTLLLRQLEPDAEWVEVPPDTILTEIRGTQASP